MESEILPSGGADSLPEIIGLDEKKSPADIEVTSATSNDEAAKIYIPDDAEEFIDPRLADYPISLVAMTVDLHNDFSCVLFFGALFISSMLIFALIASLSSHFASGSFQHSGS